MPAKNRTGDPPCCLGFFLTIPRGLELVMARWSTPSSRRVLMDAAKKLKAKGRPVDFQELLRIEPDGGTTEVRNVKARTGGAGSIRRAAAWYRSRRFSGDDTIDAKKVPRSGSLPRRAALFSPS